MYKNFIAISLLLLTFSTQCMKKNKKDYVQIQSHKNNTISLHLATEIGDKKQIKKILPYYHIDTKDNAGETSLFVAIKNNNKNMASLLLKNGADPNIVNKHGETPLLYAIQNESLQCTILLLDNGANTIIGQNDLESRLVEFYGESPAHEKIQENYTFIAPLHSYLLRKKLIPLYEQQEMKQKEKSTCNDCSIV
ncbi:MAG TPA: ankyrin repeat domain-containing protein [Candidatus Babeliales bacterium]|nr:ankyrin repeat domain-containing protein [Candidatus Babeliales bacterium]